MVYAGFWLRAFAFMIDWMIVQFAIILVGLVFALALGFGLRNEPDEAYRMAAGLLDLGLYLLYWPLLESSRAQATLGKLAVGARVTDLEGHRIGFARAFARNLAKVLSSALFLLGYVLAGFTPRKQALHDLLCGTLVVQAESLPPAPPRSGEVPRMSGPPPEHPTAR